jgi:hypothetical protein
MGRNPGHQRIQIGSGIQGTSLGMMIQIAGGEDAIDGSPKTGLTPHLSQALHLRSQLMETLVHSRGDIVHLDQRWRCLPNDF